MTIRKEHKKLFIIVLLFILLNTINTYFVTIQLLNRYTAPISRTFVGEVTSFFGNVSILFLIVIVVFLIARKDKNRIKSLLFISLFLNILILLLGYYTLFYSNHFSLNALDIFKNPSEGLSQGLFTEAINELFLYYRILVFIPSVTLLVLFIKYRNYAKINKTTDFNFSLRKILISSFSFILVFGTVNISYAGQISRKDSYNINSLNSTQGVQQYGLYPYYITEFLGIKFNHTTRKSLDINTEQELFDSYNNFNKNQKSYYNFIDGKYYSNELLVRNSFASISDELNLNDDDSLNGVFKDKNLVLVHMESLNQFLLEVPEISEKFVFLNQLLKESIVFDNFYTSVGMGVSSDAEASVLTGLYMNGYSTLYRDYEKSGLTVDTLPKLFSKKNYKSVSVHGDAKEFYNRNNAYRDFIGFSEPMFSNEDFARRENMTLEEYKESRKDYVYNGIKIKSPWPSEFETFDILEEFKEELGSKYMLFPAFISQHTPFLFDPYDSPDYSNLKNYSKLKEITKRYINYVPYLDDLIKSSLFDPKTSNSRIDTNTVYIFYSDHGSSLKNGDLNLLYDKNLSLLEERRILQQTISFIYAPGKTINPQTNLNEGLIKGRQKLTRTNTDLYRTIGDLFDLFDENDFYFGVNGLSNEPSFVIDNRIQDIIIDDINRINEDNYKPYLVSLRNDNKYYPNVELSNKKRIMDNIKYFKQLSDLIISDKTVYIDFKNALQKR